MQEFSKRDVLEEFPRLEGSLLLCVVSRYIANFFMEWVKSRQANHICGSWPNTCLSVRNG